MLVPLNVGNFGGNRESLKNEGTRRKHSAEKEAVDEL